MFSIERHCICVHPCPSVAIFPEANTDGRQPRMARITRIQREFIRGIRRVDGRECAAVERRRAAVRVDGRGTERERAGSGLDEETAARDRTGESRGSAGKRQALRQR